MEWEERARCRCGKQSLQAGRRTKDGVTTIAYDMPRWSRYTTRFLDGDTREDEDPAEGVLRDAQFRLDRFLIAREEAALEKANPAPKFREDRRKCYECGVVHSGRDRAW